MCSERMDSFLYRESPEAGLKKTFSVAYSLTVSRCLVTSGLILTIFFAKSSLLRASEVRFCRKVIRKPAVSTLKRLLLSRSKTPALYLRVFKKWKSSYQQKTTQETNCI